MVRVITVDPANEAEFRRYHETYAVGSEVGRTDPTTWTLPEARAELLEPSSSDRGEAFLALDGDVPVGAGDLAMPLREDTDQVWFDFAVPIEHRGRGIGSALFAHVVARARAEGRDKLLTEFSVTAGTEDTAPAAAFLAERGLTLRNTELRRQQRLPLASARLDELAAKAAEKAAEYRLVGWVGPCPDEYVPEYIRMRELMRTESPSGDLELDATVWDADRLRERERLFEVQKRTSLAMVAVASDGSLAGHTQIVVPAHEPGRAYQWDTLVLREHRGHRLGLALKVANLRELQARYPNVTRVETWNAAQNDAMIAVNEELGYRVIEVCQEWQGPVPGDAGGA